MMEMIIWEWEISPFGREKHIIREKYKQNEIVFALREDIIIVLNYQNFPNKRLFLSWTKWSFPAPFKDNSQSSS